MATAGVLRDVLNHRKLSLNDVCLIIFDECHHADPNSKSDYTDICQHLHAFPPGKWLPDYSRGPKVCPSKTATTLPSTVRFCIHLLVTPDVLSSD